MVSSKFLGLILFSALSLAAPAADADAEAQFDGVVNAILERDFDPLQARMETLERRIASYDMGSTLLQARDPFAFPDAMAEPEPRRHKKKGRKGHMKNGKCVCKAKKNKKGKKKNRKHHDKREADAYAFAEAEAEAEAEADAEPEAFDGIWLSERDIEDAGLTRRDADPDLIFAREADAEPEAEWEDELMARDPEARKRKKGKKGKKHCVCPKTKKGKKKLSAQIAALRKDLKKLQDEVHKKNGKKGKKAKKHD